MGKLLIGTRGSRLALMQTAIVSDLLSRAEPGIALEPKVIKTSGDLNQKSPIFEMAGDGIFGKEINEAVIDGKVDFAVHSMKDLPTAIDRRLVIAAVPMRESPSDVLISRGSVGLDDLQPGAIVGTSSIIRIAELKRSRADLRAKAIRGNVETRIKKMERGEYDALILAEAGVNRLGLQDKVAQVLGLDEFMPVAGQGALAVVASADRADILGSLKKIDHTESRYEVSAERKLASLLGVGCEAAVGVLGRASRGRLALSCTVFSPKGTGAMSYSAAGAAATAEELAKQVGKTLMDRGAMGWIAGWGARKAEVV